MTLKYKVTSSVSIKKRHIHEMGVGTYARIRVTPQNSEIKVVNVF